MKTRGRRTWGEANMPGQNMLSWVYPLAFTLLQIYFPPVKFFMRRRWLCSMVMPAVQTWQSSSTLELRKLHPLSRLQPDWPHQQVWQRCARFAPEESYQAITFLHASLWGMQFGATQLWTYIDVYVFESGSKVHYKMDLLAVAGQGWAWRAVDEERTPHYN